MNRTYDDILHCPHHVSQTRCKMTNYDRAAQFAPFAALTGYDAILDETARLTDAKIELDEGEKARLDGILQKIRENLNLRPQITAVCFEKDGRKSGGAYVCVRGRVKKLMQYPAALCLEDGKTVHIEQICDLQCSFEEEAL